MSLKLSTQVWEWYGAEEFTLVLSVCILARSLEFLALDASLQSESIPGCPACETWSSHILQIHNFIESTHKVEWNAVIYHLEAIWTACNNMSETAFHCHDREIFSNIEWDVVRQHARVALDEMEWVKIREYSEELITTCCKALFP